MNRAANLLRAIVFLLATAVSAGIFGGAAIWAVGTLDPATQEIIGLVSSPWLSSRAYPQFTRVQVGRAAVERGESGAHPTKAAGRP